MPDKVKETVLVTGAGGFVGSCAVRTILEQGKYNVIAHDLFEVDLDEAESLGAEVRKGDLTHRADCAKAVVNVDYILHLAAAYDLGLSRKALMQGNHLATKKLGMTAALAGVKHFIYCSTADTYGTHPEVPIREGARQVPDTDYSYSKLVAEQSIFRIGRETQMPVTAIRPAIIYGPGGVYTASVLTIWPFLVQKYVGFMPKPKGGPMVNAVHVDDVVGSMIYLLGRDDAMGQAFNVADDDWLPLGEFIENMWEPLGVKWKFTIPVFKMPLRIFGTMSNIMTPDFAIEWFNKLLQRQWGQVVVDRNLKPSLNPKLDRGLLNFTFSDRVYDNSKLKRAGYRFKYPHFDKGYSETINWYKQNQWLP